MEKKLSREEFEISAKQFIKVSDVLCDGWSLIKQPSKNQSYLTKKVQILMDSLNDLLLDQSVEDMLSEISIEAEDWDNEEVVMSNNDDKKEWINCEYQIVYSDSYNVPVIYCQMFTLAGILLPLEHIWKFAPAPARGWSQLTVVPHPVLDTPWVQVHPCKTAEIVGEVLSKTEKDGNYLVTFLSVYGQAVGLHLPPEYVSKIHTVK